jgi:hypothetical protein
MNSDTAQGLSLGKWLGRGQAFAVTANHSLFAQAQCWKRIHDSVEYQATGLTWAEFCEQHIGITRPRVDALIDSVEELGETFFRISEIIPISPETYRAISPKIESEAVEIDGQLVPIVPENAVRIRAAVLQMRSELRQSQQAPARDPVAAIHKRLEGCVVTLTRLTAGGALEAAGKDALRSIVEDAVLSLMALSEKLAA